MNTYTWGNVFLRPPKLRRIREIGMQFRGISVALPTLWSYSSGDLWSCSYSDYSRMEIKLKFHFTSVCVCVCRRAESPVDYKLYPWTRWKEARTREIFESGWVGRFFSQFQWAIVIRVAISHPDAMFERFVELLAVILFSFFFFQGKGMYFADALCADALG